MSFLNALLSRLRVLGAFSRRLTQSSWSYPLFLLLVGFVSYLYPLTQLGYFWDDWEVVYLTRLATPKILEGYFFFDRPLAWPYPVYAAILGAQPYLWHLLTLLLRWAGTLFFYQAFVRLWPKNRSALQWGGLLMLVYPAFLQQMIATAFSRHFTAFMLCGMSFYFTALAMQTERKKLFWVLAWITGAAQIFTIEYFAGLELVRPVFIWLLLGNLSVKEKLKRTTLLWLPFLGVFLAFGWWRVAYYPTLLSTNQFVSSARLLTDFRQSPLRALAALLEWVVQDFAYLIAQNWLSLLTDSERIDFVASSVWFGLALAAVLAFLAASLLRQDEESTQGFGMQAVWLGLAAFLFGGVPVWIIEKQVSGGGGFDNRFAIGPMVGAILLVVALTVVLVQPRWRRWIFAFLLMLGVFTQVYMVNTYRRDWASQRNYFWQLAWRAPNIKPGTAILAGYVPSTVLPDYDASFALALLYSDKPTGSQLPYWYYTWDGMKNINLKAGAKAGKSFRNLEFQGFIGQSVMVFHQPLPGCIRVADSFYGGDPALGAQNNLLGYSDLSLIEPDAAHHPSEAIFGAELPHTWCYYFQKADLARQLGRWDDVIKLYQQALSAGFAPAQGGEYLPLVEAYAQTGQWQPALTTSQTILKMTSELSPNLCAKWKQYEQLSNADKAGIKNALTAMNCP
jgi:hypothetical protein